MLPVQSLSIPLRPAGWMILQTVEYIEVEQFEKSLIAGLFSGTYGFAKAVAGLGKLSRLRDVTGPTFQFLSMNLRMET
jgi:hypothetical protein